MKKIIVLMLIALSWSVIVTAQIKGKIIGQVKDANSQENLAGAVIVAENASQETMSDGSGNFTLELPVGTYNLLIYLTGYADRKLFNVVVSSGNAQIVSVELLRSSTQELETVVVTNNRSKSARATDMITPLSTQRLTTEEIRANPGGNFDISKVIQVLPGVAGGTTANRNDIIVRGGAPNENVYYLDGIEIPVLNHFQTQGASGGATGILNVSFIEDVQLSSSAFDSRYDNALASTFVIKQRTGNPERFAGNLRLSASEFAATVEGPLVKKATYLASVRRSYLQFLFQLLELPIRPNYWDFQQKINYKLNDKTTINFIGLGAIDNFRLVAPKESTPENEYILRSNPLINQWNYTVGVSAKRLVKNGFVNIVLSRNMFYNSADRYRDNIENENNRLLKYKSFEAENKLRMDVNKYLNGFKYSYGLMAQYVKYNADVYTVVKDEQYDSVGNVTSPKLGINFNSEIDFFKFGFFTHVSKRLFNERLLLSGGLRSDMNTFTENGMNPLKTVSPRLSASYAITPIFDINFSVGRYFKLPTYTNLGFRDNNNVLTNKKLSYIQSDHLALGVQYLPREDFRITLEGFYKWYAHYPVSVLNGISLANQGAEFTAVGNEALLSSGKGNTYGAELFIQQKLINRLFYTVSATAYRSLFSGADGKLLPSSWDFGYLVSSTVGYKWPKGWDAGLKYRIAGGQPFTPFDLTASRINYLTTGVGTLDYNAINSERLPFFNQLDLRVDKRWNFKKVALNVFIDIQNVLSNKTPSTPNYTFQRNEDNTGFATTDGSVLQVDGSNAIPVILNNASGRIIPSVGFILEF